MKERMKKIGECLEGISGRAVQIIAIVILTYLSYWTAKSTFRYPLDYSRNEVLEYADSPMKNLLVAGVAVLVFYLFRCLLLGKKIDEEKKRKRVFFLAMADMIAIAVLLTAWVTVNKLEPMDDPQMIYMAVTSFQQGDFSKMEQFFYYQMYPHQYGLILLEELLTLIWQSYRVIQYLNVLFICLIIFLLYRITDLLFHDPAVDLYCLMGTTAFLPLHLYVTYVYGDICSIALSLAVVWCLLKWDNDTKWRYIVLAVICAMIAVLARKNTLISLLAVMIACVFLAWKKWSWKPLLFGLCLLVFPMGAQRGVKEFYELRSGIEISDGLPATTWIAMGMQGSWGGHGVWNGYTEHTWGRFVEEEDAQIKRKEFTLSTIQGRMEEFKEDPQMAKDFYRLKILEQWAEPSYSSLAINGSSAVGSGGLTEWIYVGVIPDLICRFQNYFQFLLYFLSLCCLVDALRRKAPVRDQVLLILLIGGFLFSVLWEAKARYVFPYVVALLPYMAKGARVLQNAVYWLIKHVRALFPITLKQ